MKVERAEIRLGEMLAVQKKTVGLGKAGRPAKKSLLPKVGIKLGDVGISHNLSSRSQKKAAERAGVGVDKRLGLAIVGLRVKFAALQGTKDGNE